MEFSTELIAAVADFQTGAPCTICGIVVNSGNDDHATPAPSSPSQLSNPPERAGLLLRHQILAI